MSGDFFLTSKLAACIYSINERMRVTIPLPLCIRKTSQLCCLSLQGSLLFYSCRRGVLIAIVCNKYSLTSKLAACIYCILWRNSYLSGAKNYCILYRLFAVFNNPLKEYNKLIKQRLFLRSPVSNVSREPQYDENKEACYEKK